MERAGRLVGALRAGEGEAGQAEEEKKKEEVEEKKEEGVRVLCWALTHTHTETTGARFKNPEPVD